ncbi:MAG: ThiF family adenylyltransferase [Ignisphaera sp.]|uniref:THIF-type NAD/FAD binding fold domain-containing protein n=1 Tax=Ignisphaera aggregans TaxID=334771 RepID=A0A7J3JNR8_9CREN
MKVYPEAFADYIERYSRQIMVLGVQNQLKLSKARVAIIGCGATGSSVAEVLARAGVGFIRIVDMDFTEISNLHRVHLYTEADARNSILKAFACRRHLVEINSSIEVESIATAVDSSNIEELVGDVDLVIDGTDNIEIRLLINEACVKLSKPWIMIGVEGWYGMVKFIDAAKTACLRCFITSTPRRRQNACNIIGVVNTAVFITTAIASTLALKHLLGCDVDEELFIIDSYSLHIKRVKVLKNSRCPVCGLNIFEHLSKSDESNIRICGGNSVEIRPQRKVEIMLEKLKKEMFRRENIIIEDHIAYIHRDGVQMALFRDGRALIKGITDVEEAKKLYHSILDELRKYVAD